MPDYSEETPLLYSAESPPHSTQHIRGDPINIHLQFCHLTGVPPFNLPKNGPPPAIAKRSLYGRAVYRRNVQNRIYLFTAALANTLLLLELVLGAALTALGASSSSHILITLFGALDTIIAGVVAYINSRGQPMRAHMFRDDLERVVDEIENSEVMWLGIQSGVHGYDEIAINDNVSVRSEVARLAELYDKVVRKNTMNDPDMYMNVTIDTANAALRARPGQSLALSTDAALVATPAPGAVDTWAPTGVVVSPLATPDDPDTSPAPAPPKSKTPPPSEDPSSSSSAPAYKGSKPETDAGKAPQNGSAA